MQEPDFTCTPYPCDDPTLFPVWVAVVFIILLIIIILAITQPKPKETPPLKKAVDDVLADFQTQARTWGDSEAATAFADARRKVEQVVDKYKNKTELI